MDLGRMTISSSLRVCRAISRRRGFQWTRISASIVRRAHPEHVPFYRFFSMSTTQSHSNSSSNANDYEHFYKYTGGRWLWDEEKQLKLRYKQFNVPALQETAAKTVGAERCESIEKVDDGSYNKVFRLVMDDGKVVIASLPYLVDGVPEFYFTASKAATMEFVGTPMSGDMGLC